MAKPLTVNWSRIKTHKNALSVVLATFGGLGLAPYAQGTFGTMGAVPFVFLFQTQGSSPWVVWGFWSLLFLVGIWAAREFDVLMGSKDSGAIVIDEVIGYAIASASCAGEPIALLTAFVLFRFFDIAKLPPCRQIDRWSKKGANPSRVGFGVMADDLVAGLQALAVVVLLQYFQVFARALEWFG